MNSWKIVSELARRFYLEGCFWMPQVAPPKPKEQTK